MGNNLSHSSEKDIKYEDFSVARSTGFPQAKILLVFLIIHG